MSTAAVPGNVRRLLDGRPQSTIRRRTGWPKQYMSNRMAGRVRWTADDLVMLCVVLDVEPLELLTPVEHGDSDPAVPALLR
jgi:hypothetical protein